MRPEVFYGLALAVSGAAVLWWKQKKTTEATQIKVDSITWKGGIDTTIVYNDAAGKSHAVYECPDGVWRNVRTDVEVAETVCTALTKAKLEHLTQLKSKVAK